MVLPRGALPNPVCSTRGKERFLKRNPLIERLFTQVPGETVRKGVGAMVRAWLWPVYGGKKDRKEPFQWTVGLRYRRIRDLFGQFQKRSSEKFGATSSPPALPRGFRSPLGWCTWTLRGCMVSQQWGRRQLPCALAYLSPPKRPHHIEGRGLTRSPGLFGMLLAVGAGQKKIHYIFDCLLTAAPTV